MVRLGKKKCKLKKTGEKKIQVFCDPRGTGFRRPRKNATLLRFCVKGSFPDARYRPNCGEFASVCRLRLDRPKDGPGLHAAKAGAREDTAPTAEEFRRREENRTDVRGDSDEGVVSRPGNAGVGFETRGFYLAQWDSKLFWILSALSQQNIPHNGVSASAVFEL